MATKTRMYRKYKHCFFCGSRKKLNIHHTTYLKKDGKSILFKEQQGNLIVLCNRCHNEWHKINGKKMYSKNTYEDIKAFYLVNKDLRLACDQLKKLHRMNEISVCKPQTKIQPKRKITYTLKKINGRWETIDLEGNILLV